MYAYRNTPGWPLLLVCASTDEFLASGVARGFWEHTSIGFSLCDDKVSRCCAIVLLGGTTIGGDLIDPSQNQKRHPHGLVGSPNTLPCHCFSGRCFFIVLFRIKASPNLLAFVSRVSFSSQWWMYRPRKRDTKSFLSRWRVACCKEGRRLEQIRVNHVRFHQKPVLAQSAGFFAGKQQLKFQQSFPLCVCTDLNSSRRERVSRVLDKGPAQNSDHVPHIRRPHVESAQIRKRNRVRSRHTSHQERAPQATTTLPSVARRQRRKEERAPEELAGLCLRASCLGAGGGTEDHRGGVESSCCTGGCCRCACTSPSTTTCSRRRVCLCQQQPSQR